MPKTALITGGSSGLGLALARELSGRGYAVLLLARDRDRLDRAVETIRSAGGAAEGFQCDIRDETALRRVEAEVRERSGAVDFLVLNAGVVTPGLLQDFRSGTELKKDLETNLWGTILCSHVFLPLLAPGSRLLMVSSGFGLVGPAGYAVYAASKAGMIAFAESLRREFLHRDIAVHVACPGDMLTPQYTRELADQPAWMKEKSPRGLLTPEEAARRILKQCGRGRFLIVINPEVHLLQFLTRLLPRALRDRLLDRVLPRPG
ncbi:SDR family NAD(P)-dependent oxidoreductase [bacterium]|nr:SDR family NAD(P)-dependent oxidoreductase [bacterium]